ncbi:MAG: AraC family transcriptional regulator [Myxococcota bacterium]
MLAFPPTTANAHIHAEARMRCYAARTLERSRSVADSQRSRAEYIERVNRVIDHLERRLDRELSLTELAKVANFSPFHFHRVFRAIVGETPQRFVQRLRLERAATALRQQPNESITAIAIDVGFSGSATFARAFRREFGVSASAWRDGAGDRKMGKPLHKLGKASAPPDVYGAPMVSETKPSLDMRVDVQLLPPTRVAYVRHTGPYAGDGALFGRLFGQLLSWAGPRDLLVPEHQMLCLYHDNPEVTDADKRRISVCLTVADDVEVGGEIGAMTVEGGKYAIAHFRLDEDQYGDAWDQLLSGWMPDSGYQPDDRLAFERYYNDPTTDPEGKHEIEICFPVRPL